MRRPVTLIVLFLALPLVAQTPVIEKIDVNVVNVDVTVTDRAGNPVRGLTRDDFQILEDGKLQKVTNFYAVENGGRAEARSHFAGKSWLSSKTSPPATTSGIARSIAWNVLSTIISAAATTTGLWRWSIDVRTCCSLRPRTRTRFSRRYPKSGSWSPVMWLRSIKTRPTIESSRSR